MIAALAGIAVRRQFARMSRGEFDVVLGGCDPHVHHRFAGHHALGGERHGLDDVRLWFERLRRLCPTMSFTVHRVMATGWPWDLTCAAEWSARVLPAAGPEYANSGVHVIRIRRGKVVELLAYEDSQAVAEACRVMVSLGVAEAGAAPITS